MPGYKGHLTGGLAAFGVTYAAITVSKVVIITSIIPVAGWLLCTLAGSLFPDIDVKSKGQNYFYWFVLAALIYLTYQKQFMPLAFLSIAATMPMLVRHRGIFHNIWFLLGGLGALSYMLMLYMPIYQQAILMHTLFFLAGALSHVWLDVGFARMFRFR